MSQFLLNLIAKIDVHESSKKMAIVRVQYGRNGDVIGAEIKRSSGDAFFDIRAIEAASQGKSPRLHHPGKNKSRRIDQWNDIRYQE